MSSSPSSASRQAGSSAAGSAKAIEPPIVPRLRIAGWPICGRAEAISGAWRAISAERSACAWRTSAPISTWPFLQRDAVEPADAVDVDEQGGMAQPHIERGDQALPAGEQRGHRHSPATRSRARPSEPWHSQTVPASSLPPSLPAAFFALSPLRAGRQSLPAVVRLVKRALPRPVPMVSTPQCAHVGHERRLAQALHHGVVVQEDHGLVLADGRDRFVQAVRQVEAAALPVARQVLRAAIDGAVRLDDAGAADADERRELAVLPCRRARSGPRAFRPAPRPRPRA